jgi:hypothetical protein
MQVARDDRLDVFFASPLADKNTVRWTVKPVTSGNYKMVMNAGSGSHPLEFVDTDGVLSIDVYAPWATFVSPYMGALLTFFGSLAEVRHASTD